MRVESNLRGGVKSIKIEFPFEVICSIPKKPFHGKIIVKYEPNKWLLEWNAFATYIESLRNREFLAEELAEHIMREIYDEIFPKQLSVTVVVEPPFHLNVEVWAGWQE